MIPVYSLSEYTLTLHFYTKLTLLANSLGCQVSPFKSRNSARSQRVHPHIDIPLKKGTPGNDGRTHKETRLMVPTPSAS